MTKWMRIFVITNFLLWLAVYGGALRGTKGLEYPAGVGAAVGLLGVEVSERAHRRRRLAVQRCGPTD